MAAEILITGGGDGTVRFWDIETACALHVLDLVRCRPRPASVDFLALCIGEVPEGGKGRRITKRGPACRGSSRRQRESSQELL